MVCRDRDDRQRFEENALSEEPIVSFGESFLCSHNIRKYRRNAHRH